MNKYGEQVANQASAYNEQLDHEKQVREDAKKTPAEIAGMDVEKEEKNLPRANIKKMVNEDGSLNLAQTSNHLISKSKLDIATEQMEQQITTMDLNNMS